MTTKETSLEQLMETFHEAFPDWIILVRGERAAGAKSTTYFANIFPVKQGPSQHKFPVYANTAMKAVTRSLHSFEKACDEARALSTTYVGEEKISIG